MNITKEDRLAYAQVLQIIRYLNEKEREKIPNEVINNYEKYKEPNYKFEYNSNIDLNEQISEKTKVIIADLFVRYVASYEDRKEIYEREKKQYIKEELQKRANLKLKPLFEDNNKQDSITDKNLPVVVEKKSIFRKIILKIKSLFIKN